MTSKKNAPWNGPKKDEPLVESWRADSIVGWFFYTWVGNDPKADQIDWQGCIVGSQGGGYYVVEYYSWLSGDPTHCSIVNLQEIEEAKWALFRDMNDRDEWHRKYSLREARKDRISAKKEPQA